MLRDSSSTTVACAMALAFGWSQVDAADQLTLPQALKRAQEVNENAAIAQERLRQADGARREAYAELLPTLTLTASYTPFSAHDDPYTDGGLDLSLRLFDPGSIPRLRQAKRLEEAQRLEAGELKRLLAFDAANGFYLVLAADALEQAATRRLGVAVEAQRQAKLRADAGLTERSTVTRTEVETATARTEQIRAHSATLKARYSLFFLLGAQPGQLQADHAWPVLVSPEPVATTTPESFATLLTQARELRADLHASQARAQAAEFAAQEPVTDTLPRFYLHGTGTYTDDATRSYRGDTTDWRASLTATWDLYDGGARYGRRERLLAVAREYTLTAEASERRLGLELSNALSDLATAMAAVEQARVRLTVARQNADETTIRFQQGLSTALEQADANVAAYEAEVELARSRFNQQQAGLTLDQAVGRWPAGSAPETHDAKP